MTSARNVNKPLLKPSLMHPVQYNFAINGLRGLCILMIFTYHIALSDLVPKVHFLGEVWPAILYFCSTFAFGVEIFFMISGYVIIGSLRRHPTVKAFLIDRVFRIYPAWIPIHVTIFTVGALVGIPFMAHIDAFHWVFYFFTNLFFLHPLYSLPMSHPASWSLSYEWIFYILAASMTVLVRGGKTRASLLVLIAAIALLNLFPRGLFFVPGILLALYEDKMKPYAAYFRFPLISLVIFLLVWNIPGAIPAEISVLMIEWFGDFRILYAIVAFLAGFYMFACILYGNGWLTHKLCSPFFQFFGKISYSFYLWSSLILSLTKHSIVPHFMPWAGAWGSVAAFAIIALSLSILVSWLSWRYAEVWLAKTVKRKLGIEKTRMQTPVAAPQERRAQ